MSSAKKSTSSDKDADKVASGLLELKVSEPIAKKSLPAASSTKVPAKKKKEVVADSWEDEISSGDEDDNKEEENQEEQKKATTTTTTTVKPKSPIGKSAVSAPIAKTKAPPLSSSSDHLDTFFSPISPLSTTVASSHASSKDAGVGGDKRQTKTDAVARRMIAGALGVRVPKSTKEQKEYEAAIRAGERKKKEEERRMKMEEERERERVRKEVWGD